MNKVEEVLKELRIRKEVSYSKSEDRYYFLGYETKMVSIEDKLENCDKVCDISREYFTNGFGRLSFRLVRN